MSKRLVLLIAIFITLVLATNLFIYFYRQDIGSVVEEYVSQITVCENIFDEQTCFTKGFCEGIYDTTCPDCSNQPKFIRCQRVSQKTLAEVDSQRKICEKTMGMWYENKLGDYCLCPNRDVKIVFDRELGCIKK
ncbi:MAG: hypothetical protein WCX71_01340 [Candidatus Buchananbacteria bacterium]|jgi:hypothetical protein